MEEILKHIIGVILGALALRYLGLNKKRIIHSQTAPAHWIWRGMRVIGKFMTVYGLFVFTSNMIFSNAINENASIGATIFGIGFMLWLVGGIAVFIKGY